MNLLQQLRSGGRGGPEQRFTVDDYLKLLTGFSFGGNQYVVQQSMVGEKERLEGNFPGMVAGAYKGNGVVFACMLTRMLVFSEARFQYRRMQNGRPGDLFGTRDLGLLERPWRGGTTGDLLTRMLVHADIAGNAFVYRRGDRLRVLRPDWITIVMGSDEDPENAAHALDSEVIGYIYEPGGPSSNAKPVMLMPEHVAHFAPIPDPIANHRGMSWLTPIMREIDGDIAASNHKLKFFENGATPNIIVSLDSTITPEKFQRFKGLMHQEHAGLDNAYKTMILGGGADVTVGGANFQQIEFKATQGAGETRIAAAAGVPPVIVGLSEGLAAATYSNYGQARRRLADGTMRPLWRNAAGSLANIIDVPDSAELWYDDRDIPFLREDRKDAAEIQSTKASTIRTLIEAGYTPESAVAAVEAEDYSLLEHTGMVSVQLQPPGTTKEPAASGGKD